MKDLVTGQRKEANEKENQAFTGTQAVSRLRLSYTAAAPTGYHQELLWFVLSLLALLFPATFSFPKADLHEPSLPGLFLPSDFASQFLNDKTAASVVPLGNPEPSLLPQRKVQWQTKNSFLFVVHNAEPNPEKVQVQQVPSTPVPQCSRCPPICGRSD